MQSIEKSRMVVLQEGEKVWGDVQPLPHKRDRERYGNGHAYV